MLPWSRFQLPPRQTQHADFPHGAFLFTSCQGLWDLSRWERFQPELLGATDSGVLAESEPVVQPPSPPPLPAEAPTFPCTHQMAPYRLFHPVTHIAKTTPCVTEGTIGHPAAQAGIDQLDHPVHWLGWIAPEDTLQLP